ncbi:MAG: hypothetical protein JTT11_09660 [Candidatus Brockarchaeota archaeon]|nr:hypothetical protein [Candidatus Brockarchaeota archaeon]
MRSGLDSAVVPSLCCLAFAALVASVVGFYWGMGLPLEPGGWSSSLIQVFLVSFGTFAVLAASWRVLSMEQGSKRLSRFAARAKLGRKNFAALIGWEIVSAAYLLPNLSLAALGFADLASAHFPWQDSLFYAFVLSQLASSLCAALAAWSVDRFT